MIAALALAAVLVAQSPASVWTASASDGVTSRITADGDELRLDYDFAAVSGYAVARRTLVRDWPANFVIEMKVRGTGGVNDLQIKFTDADSKNVWWVQRRNFRPSPEWQTIRIKPRDIGFAWGPTGDKSLRRTAIMEIVMVRGRDGGAGHLEIGDIAFTPLPPPVPLPPPRLSDARGLEARRTLGRPLTIDFGGPREIGGVTLHWGRRFAPRYRVEASEDGRQWRTVRSVTAADGGNDPLALPDLETRYLRLSADGKPELAGIEIMPVAWSATPNATIAALAKAAPRGTYPRGFTEQSYWTLVASDGGAVSGLIGEDGAIEVAKGGFSIEPFVIADGKRFSWADVASVQSLRDGFLPLPGVHWRSDGWTLDTTLVAEAGGGRLLARWRLTNTSDRPRTLKLALGVRPFQVNPAAQFLSQQGGVSPISRIAWGGGRVAVTTPPAIAGDPVIVRNLFPVVAPTDFTARPFDQGALVVGDAGTASIDDPTDLASATMGWTATLAPGATLDVPIAIEGSTALDRARFDAAERTTASYWQRTLDTVTITAPPAKRAIADTVKTALAHILMSREGPALKPGTRSYDRSWIRDGAMMGDSLLRLGHPAPVRAFADWYGTKLFANGKVPCCVDARGPDPVPENDSQGEYIHLVTQLYRYTGDRAALARDWAGLDAARRYMEAQRQSERGPANLTPERRHLYGLMPPSISHEGYSTEAQYSLWDDFWALTGYKDAAFAAAVLNRPERASIVAQRDQFAGDIHAAIAAATKRFGIDFIPGAVSLGDFDATSTTIALDPADEANQLDHPLLANTFARKYDRVMARGAPDATWADYTPYELRNVSALVRLGQRGRANDLLSAYMADRRPAAWNGWAEVVGRNPREIRFIGDMPHAWVASDFIRAALDLFAYVEKDTIVLAAGLDAAWLEGSGTAIRGLRTPYGSVTFSARERGGALIVDLSGDAKPPGGFLLDWPFAGRPGVALVDGVAKALRGNRLPLPAGSATRVEWRPAN